MLDIGWSELILIGVVALIVIGPKDLPDMFRQLGRFTAKLRAMARDFSRAMEQAAAESGVKDVARDLKSVASPQSLGLNAMKDAAAKFEKWDPLKNAATPNKLPTPAQPAASTDAAAPTAEAPAAVGPQTQALRDQQAARQAIVKESTEKLRAIARPAPAAPVSAAPPAQTPADMPAPPPASKPRSRAAKPASASAPDIAPDIAAEKPKAARKPKKTDQA